MAEYWNGQEILLKRLASGLLIPAGQTIRLYDTTVEEAGAYERFEIFWDTGVAYIQTVKNAGGSIQGLCVGQGDRGHNITFDASGGIQLTTANNQNLTLYLGGNGYFLVNRTADGILLDTTRDDISVGAIRQVKVSKAYNSTLFDAAALTDNAIIWQQPAGTVLLGAMMKLPTQFVAPAASSLVVTMGLVGDEDGLLLTTGNLKSATVYTEYTARGAYWSEGAAVGILCKDAATDWSAYGTAVDGNINTFTAGQLDFYFTYWQP